MSQTLYLIPQPHVFSRMPLTHHDSPITPTTKRKLPFSEEPLRTPPHLRDLRPQPEVDAVAAPRLKANPYSSDQMTMIPQPRRMSPSVPSPPRLSNEKLPSIRDIIPELSPLDSQPHTNQPYGPDSFQPSGPTTRLAAAGLAPSPLTSSRHSQYPSQDPSSGTLPLRDRQYAASAPAGSQNSTTRNSPVQPHSSGTPQRPGAEPIRALPPLASFGPPESTRPAASYPSYPTSGLPPTPHYPGQPLMNPNNYRSGTGPPPGQYGHAQGLQPSPPYAHYDNSDYGSDGKSKRRRGNLPKQVTDTLRKWFNEHIAHPYPTEDEKMMLMSQTNLTMSQISNWFINARRRNLPSMPRDGGEGNSGPQLFMREGP